MHTPVLLAVLTAAVSLTGCALNVSSGPDAEDKPSVEVSTPVEASTPVETAAPSATTGGESDSESRSETPSQTPAEGSIRTKYADAVTTEVRCVDGTAKVAGQGSVVRLADTCDKLVITGNGAVVLAQQVGTLQIDAVGVVVVVSEADDISLSASSVGSIVSWEKGSPSVDDKSTGSVVMKDATVD